MVSRREIVARVIESRVWKRAPEAFQMVAGGVSHRKTFAKRRSPGRGVRNLSRDDFYRPIRGWFYEVRVPVADATGYLLSALRTGSFMER